MLKYRSFGRISIDAPFIDTLQTGILWLQIERKRCGHPGVWAVGYLGPLSLYLGIFQMWKRPRSCQTDMSSFPSEVPMWWACDTCYPTQMLTGRLKLQEGLPVFESCLPCPTLIPRLLGISACLRLRKNLCLEGKLHTLKGSCDWWAGDYGSCLAGFWWFPWHHEALILI